MLIGYAEAKGDDIEIGCCCREREEGHDPGGPLLAREDRG
jgi:hypothetical protein